MCQLLVLDLGLRCICPVRAARTLPGTCHLSPSGSSHTMRMALGRVNRYPAPGRIRSFGFLHHLFLVLTMPIHGLLSHLLQVSTTAYPRTHRYHTHMKPSQRHRQVSKGKIKLGLRPQWHCCTPNVPTAVGKHLRHFASWLPAVLFGPP